SRSSPAALLRVECDSIRMSIPHFCATLIPAPSGSPPRPCRRAQPEAFEHRPGGDPLDVLGREEVFHHLPRGGLRAVASPSRARKYSSRAPSSLEPLVASDQNGQV